MLSWWVTSHTILIIWARKIIRVISHVLLASSFWNSVFISELVNTKRIRP